MNRYLNTGIELAPIVAICIMLAACGGSAERQDAPVETMSTVQRVIQDRILPSVSITSPTVDASVASTQDTLVLAGTASDNQQVNRVTWVSDRGASGSAVLVGSSLSVSWSTEPINLAAGLNTLTVSAFDMAGNVSRKSLAVSYSTTAPTRWSPRTSDTWQWQLTGALNLSYAVTMYDFDIVDTPITTITDMRSIGKRVVCYFSAGSAENWRPDYAMFLPSDMGNALSGWAGERWLDTRSDNVRKIMALRLDDAVKKGCDAVEPDNVDGYTNGPGFPLTAATQLDYNRFLAREAHARGLAVGLKNDVSQLTELEPDFDFAINEQCFQYNECAGYSVFTQKGKPVFNAEYASKYRTNTGGARDALCVAAKAANLRTLVLSVNLDDSFRFSCD